MSLRPLIELHLHLDGAITVEIARELARLQNIALPAADERQLLALLSVPETCRDLNDFLACFAFPLSLLQTAEGIREAVRLVLENLCRQGVIYAEVRFAPQLHTRRGLTQEDAVRAAIQGLRRAPIPANLILCCMRGENLETVHLAREYLVEHGGVTGLDLAGAEALYPNEQYREEFALASRWGIPVTIHAGEAAGADSVRSAVALGARRIGHGVRMREDPEVVRLVRERGIFLEMCPTSNRQTRAVTEMDAYPLVDYLNQGIRVTLNTDDMGISRITLPGEFQYMEQLLGLTEAQERQLLHHAVDGAFTSEEIRIGLRKRLEAEWIGE